MPYKDLVELQLQLLQRELLSYAKHLDTAMKSYLIQKTNNESVRDEISRMREFKIAQNDKRYYIILAPDDSLAASEHIRDIRIPLETTGMPACLFHISTLITDLKETQANDTTDMEQVLSATRAALSAIHQELNTILEDTLTEPLIQTTSSASTQTGDPTIQFLQRTTELADFSADAYATLSSEMKKTREAIRTFTAEIEEELRKKLIKRKPGFSDVINDRRTPLRIMKLTNIGVQIILSHDEQPTFFTQERDPELYYLARKYLIAQQLSAEVEFSYDRTGDIIQDSTELVERAEAFRKIYTGENRDFLRSHPDSGTIKVLSVIEDALNAIGKVLGWKEFTFSKDKRGVALAKQLDSANLATSPHTMHSARKSSKPSAAAEPSDASRLKKR